MAERNGSSSGGKLSVRAGVGRKLLERKATERAAEAAQLADGVEALFPSADQAGADEAGEADRGPFCALHDQYLSDRAAERDVALAGRDASQAEAPDATNLRTHVAGEPHGMARNAPAAGHVAAHHEPTNAAPEQPAHLPATQPTAPAPWRDEDESAFQALLARRTATGRGKRGRAVTDQLIGLGPIKPNPDTVVAVIVALVAERGGSVPRGELVVAMADATFPHPKAQPTDRSWCQGYIAGAVRSGFLTSATEPAAAVAA